MTAEPRPALRIVKDGAAPADDVPAHRAPAPNVTGATGERLSSQAGRGHLTDEAVAAAKRGEAAAWEAAYVAYGRELKGFLMVRLNDRDDAAEAFSETFFRAFERIGSLRTSTANGFRAWLYRIARNVATDRLRARRRLTYVAEPQDGADVFVGDFDDAMVSSEEAAQVRHAFAALDEDDREVLWLRVCADLSSDEVGEIVGKRPGTVRMQQQRALVTLSRRLDL
ncbi:MAG TPA: sigma-70 family RNA polymerase sigma factor [Acidimicrobiales bacterium]|nr:sigma-70 family RNA polymerase sigma factor [Acidimicrobiales bacterium]